MSALLSAAATAETSWGMDIRAITASKGLENEGKKRAQASMNLRARRRNQTIEMKKTDNRTQV